MIVELYLKRVLQQLLHRRTFPPQINLTRSLRGRYQAKCAIAATSAEVSCFTNQDVEKRTRNVKDSFYVGLLHSSLAIFV